jgi:hypothetical protein
MDGMGNTWVCVRPGSAKIFGDDLLGQLEPPLRLAEGHRSQKGIMVCRMPSITAGINAGFRKHRRISHRKTSM